MDRQKKTPRRQMVKIQKELKKDYEELKTKGGWRAVGKRYGISCGMAYRVAMDCYEPSDIVIRRKLGLKVMKPAPVCPFCGEVHIRKSCPHRRKVVHRWADLPMDQLRFAIENREEF